MRIQIGQIPLGALQTNCYLLGDTETKEAIIIDPAADGARIMEHVALQGYTVRLILATHTHFDHVLASHHVKAASGAPFWLHAEGLEQLQAMQSRAQLFGIPADDPPATPDHFIADKEIIEIGAMRLEARYTPGHSPGHLIFVMHAEQVAFVGDCVFYGGIGRTDLPGGSAARLRQSIEEEILPLDDAFTLCTGHGGVTSLGRERRENMFLADLLQL